MIVHDAANRVIHLRIGPDDCALRVPQLSDAQLQVDRHSERAAIAAATKAGLAPEMLACDPRSGILITRWIDEPVWTAAQARATTNIGHIAGLLRQLHRLPIPAGVRTLDLGELIRGYWNQITARQPALAADLAPRHTSALQLLRTRAVPDARFCHNDLHAGNIIGPGPATRLLDWEYAGVGAPLFDLASYAQSNDLTAPQRHALLEQYGAPNATADFALECRLFDWICILWLAASGVVTTPAGAERFNALLRRSSE